MKQHSPIIREYTIRDMERLRAPRMPEEEYSNAHRHLSLPCHDVFIEYDDGILLVVRDQEPAKGELWPVGGRADRGLPIEESLRKKAWEESRLELENIIWLGMGHTPFADDPFGHGHGTDTHNYVFYAEGRGKLKLDSNHRKPLIVAPDEYRNLSKSLRPYVRDFMDVAIRLAK